MRCSAMQNPTSQCPEWFRYLNVVSGQTGAPRISTKIFPYSFRGVSKGREDVGKNILKVPVKKNFLLATYMRQESMMMILRL